MTDFPPAWPKWLPLAKKILAHPVYSGQRQYGAGGADARLQLEHDERSLAKLLAREMPASAAPLDGG